MAPSGASSSRFLCRSASFPSFNPSPAPPCLSSLVLAAAVLRLCFLTDRVRALSSRLDLPGNSCYSVSFPGVIPSSPLRLLLCLPHPVGTPCAPILRSIMCTTTTSCLVPIGVAPWGSANARQWLLILVVRASCHPA